MVTLNGTSEMLTFKYEKKPYCPQSTEWKVVWTNIVYLYRSGTATIMWDKHLQWQNMIRDLRSVESAIVTYTRFCVYKHSVALSKTWCFFALLASLTYTGMAFPFVSVTYSVLIAAISVMSLSHPLLPYPAIWVPGSDTLPCTSSTLISTLQAFYTSLLSLHFTYTAIATWGSSCPHTLLFPYFGAGRPVGVLPFYIDPCIMVMLFFSYICTPEKNNNKDMLVYIGNVNKSWYIQVQILKKWNQVFYIFL